MGFFDKRPKTPDSGEAQSPGETFTTEKPADAQVHAARTSSSASQKIEDPNNADSQEKVEDDDTEYPTSFKLVLISIALCLTVFCIALDNTIIATAIPRITDHFKAIDDIAWYGSAYLLTTCSFQLFFGKLYTFLNIKVSILQAH